MTPPNADRRDERRSSRRLVLALAAAAVALAAVPLILLDMTAGNAGTHPRQQLYGFMRQPPLRVGAYSLPVVASDGASHPITFRASAGSLLLVYFGYTYCPDICPTTLANLGAALNKLPATQRSRIAFAMVTVDPHRDTPAILNTYLGHFLPSALALRTTNWSALKRVEHAFDASSTIGPKQPGGGYEVTHTAEIYAVDDSGTVREEWLFGVTPSELASDFRWLLGRLQTGTPNDSHSPERTS